MKSVRTLVALAALIAFAAPTWSADKSDATQKTTTASTAPAAHRINVNTASKEDLEALPGIGPATAQAIIDARPFKSVAELKSVKGIGETRFEEILPHVTVKNAGSTTAIGGPGNSKSASASSDKPSAEAQEKNRTPKHPGADSNVGAPETPGSGSDKPTAEAQVKNRSASGSSASSTSRSEHSAKVNLNTASKEELEALPGIGPVKAQAIIDARPFKNVDDVKKVNGIKDATYDKIKDQITVQ